MSIIKSFKFTHEGIESIRTYKYGRNWPVVYLIENGKELYVGETVRAYGRTKEHFVNSGRKNLDTIHIIADDEYNMSATKDAESSLIEYLVADGTFKLQNGNKGLQNHDFFDREKYRGKFEIVWQELQKMGIARNDLLHIRNSDIFKYSPYKTLTDDQYFVANQLIAKLKQDKAQSFLIHGGPGTGKTILATYTIKRLVEEGITNVALVIAMTPLRNTLQKVFRSIPGLKSSMVIGPSDAVKSKYEVLIVDEAHRLRRRKNIPNYGTHDAVNRSLGLGNDGDELDWLVNSANKLVLFYDDRQSVRPSDILPSEIKKLKAHVFELKTQKRVLGGDEYVQFIDNVLEVCDAPTPEIQNYDFRLYDDISEMVEDIKEKDEEHQLGRLVAGYAWEWKTKGGKEGHDIEIGEVTLKWNSQLKDWVNSPNARNEVGCIHTIQGYDLNYTGVIIGPEVSFNTDTREIVVDRTEYRDLNGLRGVTDPEELKRYIINIYKTLLTRGIMGTYVYVCDEKLRRYFKERLGQQPAQDIVSPIQFEEAEVSNLSGEFVQIPLVGSAPCGSPLLGEENIEDYISVPKEKIKLGFQYFILQAEGDSMNLAGINDGDLLLCYASVKPETGDRVVALLGSENVTIKYYSKMLNRRVLLPKSTNPKHKEIFPEEGDSVQGVVQEVLNIE